MAKRKNKIPIFKSSGNVFADLGLANPGEKQTRVRLAVAINHVIAERHLSQARAARELGINQPKISALSRYRLEGFSVERLMHLLGRVGCEIEFVIRLRANSSSRKPARILVSAA